MRTYYGLDASAHEFYHATLQQLLDERVPFIVGGGYALRHYTHIEREPQDLDLFVRRTDFPRVQAALRAKGITTELEFPHWLGKAKSSAGVIDVIFSSGNGVSEVDDGWFEHACPARVLGIDVHLVPPEEIIWSKAFIMERERFDGADILHLIRAAGDKLDWQRLLCRFDAHWRVLLAHLTIFGFVYPCDRARVPAEIMRILTERLREETMQSERGELLQERVCHGTLLSRAQYLVDIEDWRYQDARLIEPASMTREQISQWTAAIPESN